MTGQRLLCSPAHPDLPAFSPRFSGAAQKQFSSGETRKEIRRACDQTRRTVF
jgi:hypothetical protein